MFEEWDDGGGVLWGTVVSCMPGSTLQILGSLFPNWGGPTQWYGTWDLAADGEATVLKYSQTGVGRVSEAAMGEQDKGWQFLCDALKANVEGQPAPVWVD